MVPNQCEGDDVETVTITRDSLRGSPKVGGSGDFNGSRDVWLTEYDGKPCVVKYDAWGSDNSKEVMVWEFVKDTPIAHLFAEVYAHSDDDHFIVMERAADVISNDARVRELYFARPC